MGNDVFGVDPSLAGSVSLPLSAELVTGALASVGVLISRDPCGAKACWCTRSNVVAEPAAGPEFRGAGALVEAFGLPASTGLALGTAVPVDAGALETGALATGAVLADALRLGASDAGE